MTTLDEMIHINCDENSYRPIHNLGAVLIVNCDLDHDQTPDGIWTNIPIRTSNLVTQKTVVEFL